MTLIFKGKNRVTQRYKPGIHNGLDIVGDDCKDVICPVEGVVRSSTIITNKKDKTWEWGNYVRVDDAQGNRLFFCHLASRAAAVGQRVKPGDKLGVMGNTGYSFGAHTHFEARKADGKTRLNPAEYLGIANAEGTYTESAAPAENGWEQKNGQWYWREKGSPATSKWVKDNGYWYYLGPDGAMLTGMQEIGGKVYYLNEERRLGVPKGACVITDGTGAMVCGKNFQIGTILP